MPKGIILRTQLDGSFICGMLLKLYKHNKRNSNPLKYIKIRVKIIEKLAILFIDVHFNKHIYSYTISN